MKSKYLAIYNQLTNHNLAVWYVTEINQQTTCMHALMQIHVNIDTYVLLLFYILHCFCVISNDPLTILNTQYAPAKLENKQMCQRTYYLQIHLAISMCSVNSSQCWLVCYYNIAMCNQLCSQLAPSSLIFLLPRQSLATSLFK